MPLLKLETHETDEESKIGNILITVLPQLKGPTGGVQESTAMVSSEEEPKNHEPITIVQH